VVGRSTRSLGVIVRATWKFNDAQAAATIEQGFARGLIHFGMAVAGLVAFGVCAGMFGWMEPFWAGGKGAFLLVIGIPLLLIETIAFLLLLQWRSSLSKNKVRILAIVIAAFLGGAALTWLYVGVSRGISALSLGDSEVFVYGLLGAAAACAVFTSILTWLVAACFGAKGIRDDA
jgi:hypothetical protein